MTLPGAGTMFSGPDTNCLYVLFVMPAHQEPFVPSSVVYDAPLFVLVRIHQLVSVLLVPQFATQRLKS